MTSKITKVKNHFEQSALYLADNFNIQYRQEIIQNFLGDSRYCSILDVACGNAEISLSYLDEMSKLTLVDISTAMLNAASCNIPNTSREQVNFRQGDFLSIDLPKRSFDLIICTGLLAHISDPYAALNKMAELLMPNGTIILQNTNAAHPYSWLLHAARSIGAVVNKDKYSFNRISERSIIKLFEQQNIYMVSRFCYLQSLPLLDRIINPQKKYKILKEVFGNERSTFLNRIGNECLYHFNHSHHR